MVEVDHVFICTARGAPAASRLRDFGLTEGPPNRHPGQGTACRRFFFQNAMLELVWVEDPAEAQSEQTRRTQLWERWSNAGQDACPFGIILRPAPADSRACPFACWEYRPASVPNLSLQIANGTDLNEPMWCFMDVIRPRLKIEHPAGLRTLTRVSLNCHALPESWVTRRMAKEGAIELHEGPAHLLDLEFDCGGQRKTFDFRPDLPLRFRY
jgi:hypothetical protein